MRGVALACATLLGVLAVTATPAAAILSGLQQPAIGYTFHFFSDVDGVDVYSQHASTGVLFGSDGSLSLDYVHDVVVIPAIEAPPGSQEAVDAITTASRPISSNNDPYEDFVKARDEIVVNAGYYGARVSYYMSSEEDYFAQMVTVEYSKGLLQENLTLTGGMSYGWDEITPIDDIRSQGIPDEQTTVHGTPGRHPGRDADHRPSHVRRRVQ